MSVCYKKLWKLLIDKDITRAELQKKTGVASSTFSKIKNNEFVSLEVLIRICCVLECGLDDILEIERERDN